MRNLHLRKMYILHKVSIKSNKQYQKRVQRKIECYKDEGCELKVNEDDDSYPEDVTHVYAQNQYCNEWNNKRITSLQGDKYECVAFESKKDHYTELTTKDVSLKPQKMGNLRKVLHIKVGASYAYNKLMVLWELWNM